MKTCAVEPTVGQQTVSPVSPVRMIALDLDGTLLRTDKSVGPETLKALQAARARGVEIVLASGRMAASIERVAAGLGVNVCLISCNGSVVHGPAHDACGRKLIFYQPLKAEVAREIVAFGKARRYQVNFYHGDCIYSEDGPHLRPWIEIYHSRTNSPFTFVENLNDYLHLAPPKVIFVVDPKIRNALLEELEPQVRVKIEKNVSADLTKLERAEILRHF